MRIWAFLLLLFSLGCYAERLERVTVTPTQSNALPKTSRTIKVHTNDGGLYILEQWHIDTKTQVVSGKGKQLDSKRDIVSEGVFSVNFSQVAVLETNEAKSQVGSVAPLAVATVFSFSSALIVLLVISANNANAEP